ncbi:lysostaphin resistance A-like protein [Roseobacteraceae bacterium NS-SX3]
MAYLFQTLPQIWPWLILMAAMAAGWAGRRGLAFALLAACAAAAVAEGRLSPLAAAALATGLLFAAFLPRTRGVPALIGHAVLVLWSLALGAHLLPGVENLPVLDQVRAGPDSAPYSMHLNLDKPLVFLALLLAWPPLLKPAGCPAARPGSARPEGALLPFDPRAVSGLAPHLSNSAAPNALYTALRRADNRAMFTGLLLLAALFPLALLTGALRWEPSLPAWTLLWMLSNLLLTCLAEEAFFRGYLQQGLSRRFGPAAGIGAASLLFGLAHLGAGPAVAGFASLLGLACGLGYWGSGRFGVPVLMHFAFNLTHLLLFTYPGPA